MCDLRGAAEKICCETTNKRAHIVTCARTVKDVRSNKGVSPHSRMCGQFSAGRVKVIWRAIHTANPTCILPPTPPPPLWAFCSMMSLRVSFLCLFAFLLLGQCKSSSSIDVLTGDRLSREVEHPARSESTCSRRQVWSGRRSCCSFGPRSSWQRCRSW